MGPQSTTETMLGARLTYVLLADMILTQLTNSMVSVAVPTMLTDLGVGDERAGWIISAYLLPVAVLDRPGWRLKALASPAAHAFPRARLDESDATLLTDLVPPAWTFLTLPLTSVSSTAIRAAARLP